MNTPRNLRIGYRDYKVESWPVREAHAAGRLGECDQLNAVIRVSEERTGYDALDTLLHETLHAIFHVGDIDPADGEERIVSRIAPLFVQVWRDNPELRECFNGVESRFAASWRGKMVDPRLVEAGSSGQESTDRVFYGDGDRVMTPEEGKALALLVTNGVIRLADGSLPPAEPAPAATEMAA